MQRYVRRTSTRLGWSWDGQTNVNSGHDCVDRERYTRDTSAAGERRTPVSFFTRKVIVEMYVSRNATSQRPVTCSPGDDWDCPARDVRGSD